MNRLPRMPLMLLRPVGDGQRDVTSEYNPHIMPTKARVYEAPCLHNGKREAPERHHPPKSPSLSSFDDRHQECLDKFPAFLLFLPSS